MENTIFSPKRGIVHGNNEGSAVAERSYDNFINPTIP